MRAKSSAIVDGNHARCAMHRVGGIRVLGHRVEEGTAVEAGAAHLLDDLLGHGRQDLGRRTFAGQRAGCPSRASASLFDAAAAVVDARSSGAGRTLVPNVVISSLAALRVWGVWAILAGALQFVLALQRRGLGGQGAMIFSGGLSTLVGASFIAVAAQDDPSLTALSGYALLGGVFFLVSALRLR